MTGHALFGRGTLQEQVLLAVAARLHALLLTGLFADGASGRAHGLVLLAADRRVRLVLRQGRGLLGRACLRVVILVSYATQQSLATSAADRLIVSAVLSGLLVVQRAATADA